MNNIPCGVVVRSVEAMDESECLPRQAKVHYDADTAYFPTGQATPLDILLSLRQGVLAGISQRLEPGSIFEVRINGALVTHLGRLLRSGDVVEVYLDII